MPGKLERCVKAVKKQGGKYNPYAVCGKSTGWVPGKGSTKKKKHWVHKETEDIEKYATPEEKLFLEGLEDFLGGDTAITGEDEAQEQNPTGKKWLRRQALKKKLGGSGDLERDVLRQKYFAPNAGGANFLQPFDKNGEPRKYLKILLGLEAEPGLTKLEIYRDILGRPYSPAQAKGQDTASLWTPLHRAGLIDTKREGTKIKYYPGPNWPKYKFEILGQEE